MRYYVIGTQFAYEILGFVLLGVGIDYYFGTSPWWAVGLGLPGSFLALFHLIRSVQD